MEKERYGERTVWRKICTEKDPNGKRSLWKKITKEKDAAMEDDDNGRPPQWKTTS